MQKRKLVKVCLVLGDFFIMQIALFLTLWLRNRDLVNQFKIFSYNFIVLYILWIGVLFILNLYDLYFFKKPIDFLFNVIIFSFLATSLGVAYFYFRPELGLTPKTILLLHIAVYAILFFLWRYAVNIFLQWKGVKEKVVIVGFQENLKDVVGQMEKNYEVLAIFLPAALEPKVRDHIFSDDTTLLTTMTDLKKTVIEKKATTIIFALDFHSHHDVVREIFSHLPLTLNYVEFEDVYEFMQKKVSLESLDEVWFLEKISKSSNKINETIKRIFDIVLGLVGLLLFMVLFPIIALAIKMDSPGDVFYQQKRVGKNGRAFLISKFRTMEESDAAHKQPWREKDTKSVTRVGKALRRLHLDELPQAWSIVKGDLSFVGPRPEWTVLAGTFEKEIPFYRQRYLVKPGIIGWAQINFPASRSLDEVKEKFQYDLYYIKNQSFLLDLEIILKAIKLFIW